MRGERVNPDGEERDGDGVTAGPGGWGGRGGRGEAGAASGWREQVDGLSEPQLWESLQAQACGRLPGLGQAAPKRLPLPPPEKLSFLRTPDCPPTHTRPAFLLGKQTDLPLCVEQDSPEQPSWSKEPPHLAPSVPQAWRVTLTLRANAGPPQGRPGQAHPPGHWSPQGGWEAGKQGGREGGKQGGWEGGRQGIREAGRQGG